MYIITVNGKEKEGAYSQVDEDGDDILYIFEKEDDATRYSMQLEDLDYPEMKILEIDEDLMINTCRMHGQRYTIITPDDIVIPRKPETNFL